MKKLITACVIAIFSLTLHAFDVVVRHDGSTTVYPSQNVDKVTFSTSGTVAFILKDGSSVYFPADQFESIDFDGTSIDGVVSISESTDFKIEGTSIVSTHGAIEIFDAKGSLRVKGDKSVSIASLPAGIYIVKSSVHTAKIALR